MSLVFNGTAWVHELCQKALRSPKGLAHINSIELLKDSRIDHFKHEWLVLWLSHETERYILYLERSWDHETDEGWEAWIPPLFGQRTIAGVDGQQRNPEYDEAFFFQEGDEQEQERRRNSVTIFAIQFHAGCSSSSPLTLRTVCEVLLDYHDKHPAYILLGANCWAWSRAILLAVVSKADNVSSIVINKKSEPVTPEQFKMYLFTEYGAWGGMLLHVIARRTDNNSSLLRFAFMRVLIACYPFIPWVAWLKTRIFGYLNWTLRLRQLSVREDETSMDNGVNCTYTVFTPDLTDLIPALIGQSAHPLAHSFCSPGNYLYLLTPPVAAHNARILSIHIFLFGLVYNEAPLEANVTSMNTTISGLWFECGILRHTEDGLKLVSDPGKCSLDVVLRPSEAKNRFGRGYAGIHTMEHRHPLLCALHEGDLIAVWANGRANHIHKPAIVSVKVVVQRRMGIEDYVFAIDTLIALLKVIKSISYSPLSLNTATEINRLILRLFAYTPYFMDKFCGDWAWKRISEVAMQLLWSVTPVILPTSNQPCTDMSLVNFLQSLFPSTPETEGSSFSVATVRFVELISFASLDQHEKLAAEVRYRDNTYVLHFERPSDLKSVRKHYISFLWSSHGFTQDVVKLSLLGESGALRAPGSKSEVKVYFNCSDTDNDKTLKLHDLGRILNALKKDYWWYFWLNSRIWTWPYTATKTLFSKFKHAVVKIEIDGHDGSLSWAQASDILSKKCEGWRHAGLRRNFTWKGIASGEDLWFIMWEARARYIVWFYVIGVIPVLAIFRSAYSTL